jgi:hypothetical protein
MRACQVEPVNTEYPRCNDGFPGINQGDAKHTIDLYLWHYGVVEPNSFLKEPSKLNTMRHALDTPSSINQCVTLKPISQHIMSTEADFSAFNECYYL